MDATFFNHCSSFGKGVPTMLLRRQFQDLFIVTKRNKHEFPFQNIVSLGGQPVGRIDSICLWTLSFMVVKVMGLGDAIRDP